MPKIEVHCQDCINELGEDFKQVHIWLDEFAEKMGPNHRDVRHHEGGIRLAKEKWGERAAKAAEIHIRADCHGIVPTETQAKLWSLFGSSRIPKNGATFLSDEDLLGK
jgi:DNA-binding GntR family transcriptional regulator